MQGNEPKSNHYLGILYMYGILMIKLSIKTWWQQATICVNNTTAKHQRPLSVHQLGLTLSNYAQNMTLHSRFNSINQKYSLTL